MKIAEYKAMAAVEQTHWWFVSRRLFVANVLRNFGIHSRNGSRIADIGAGTGGMMQFLSTFGRTVGIEPNSSGRRYAKKKNIVLQRGFADKTTLPSRSYDIVCFFDVLYHQGIDEDAALTEARRLLVPGGMLVITDCALPFLHSPHDVHVMGKTRYTASSLSHLVARNNFEIRYISYTFFLLFPFVLAWRLLQKLAWFLTGQLPAHSNVGGAPVFFNWLLPMICRLEAHGLGKISYPWGSSLILVATS